MRTISVAPALALLVVTACGDPAPSRTTRALPATLGACSLSGTLDGPDAAEFVSMPGAWVRIDAIDAAGAGTRTKDFAGSFTVVGGDGAMTAALGAAPETLRMHGSVATASAQALALGASVHAHTGVTEDPRHVAFALALKDDEFAFLGECQDRMLTQPIADRLGAGAAATLARLVGAPSAELRRVLVPAPAPVSGEPILNPEVAPSELLAKLETGFFALRSVPDSWYGPYTICTRIAAGWSDCVDLASRSTAAIKVNYYFDPAEPAVEVWLLDADATVAQPIARLATLDLAGLARRQRIDLGKPGVNLAVTLPAEPSVRAVAADPAEAPVTLADVRLSYD